MNAEARDQQDRAAIARGLNDEAEFHAWYDAEIEPRRGPYSFREIARLAFHQGRVLGREGRA